MSTVAQGGRSSVVLLLTGPLQAWGEYAPLYRRTTTGYPTKSGAIGMVSSALGRSRDADISDLVALHYRVRVDSEGELLTDFHTVMGVSGTKENEPKLTDRQYLMDAAFVVTLTGDPSLIGTVARAVQQPRWIPYLGRKVCSPGLPMFLGVTNEDPVGLLHRLPIYGIKPKGGETTHHVFIAGNAESGKPHRHEVRDVPVAFGNYPVTHTRRKVSHQRVTPRVYAGTGFDAHSLLAETIKEEGN